MGGQVAAAVIGALGVLALAAHLVIDHEVWSALAFLFGAPMAAVGALTLGWTRLEQHVPVPGRGENRDGSSERPA